MSTTTTEHGTDATKVIIVVQDAHYRAGAEILAAFAPSPQGHSLEMISGAAHMLAFIASFVDRERQIDFLRSTVASAQNEINALRLDVGKLISERDKLKALNSERPPLN